MGNWVLRSPDGTTESVQEDSSCDIVITLVDTSGKTISTGAISSIKASLMLADGAIINSRNEQDVLGTNGGSVASGVFKQKLDASDNQVFDNTMTAGSYETHYYQLTYSWTDGDGDTRVNVETFQFNVEKQIDPAP